MQKVKVSLDEFNAAKSSVAGRLGRLRKTSSYWGSSKTTPIEKIGVFNDEIDSMHEILTGMKNRLDNASVTIKI